MTELTVIISAIASVMSALAAALAWLAKLRWSQEFAAAKDETIKTKDAQIVALREQFQETLRVKDAQIEGLKEFTPIKVREYFVSVKQQLEEYIDNLKGQLQQKQEAIEKLERTATANSEELSSFREQRKQLEQEMAQVVNGLNELDKSTYDLNAAEARFHAAWLNLTQVASPIRGKDLIGWYPYLLVKRYEEQKIQVD